MIDEAWEEVLKGTPKVKLFFPVFVFHTLAKFSFYGDRDRMLDEIIRDYVEGY